MQEICNNVRNMVEVNEQWIDFCKSEFQKAFAFECIRVTIKRKEQVMF